jgi:ArsR family metal-binding transcriptional regulator
LVFCSVSGYNMGVSSPDKLITDFQYELVEDHHSFGSGRYGLKVTLPVDISPSFPYLNAVMKDTIYDHENGILIGFNNGKRYAFRPHEIHLGMVADPSDISGIIEEVVELVNRVWSEREKLEPSFKERERPPVFEIYQLLPRTNCKECGYPTCLAFAADIRNGMVQIDQCTKLSDPEYADKKAQITALLSSG